MRREIPMMICGTEDGKSLVALVADPAPGRPSSPTFARGSLARARPSAALKRASLGASLNLARQAREGCEPTNTPLGDVFSRLAQDAPSSTMCRCALGLVNYAVPVIIRGRVVGLAERL